MDKNKMNVAFAAVGTYIEDNIIENNQKEIKGKEIIEYGDKNIYPNYLYDLYENVSVVKSIVNGISGCFGNITINLPEYQKQINENGDTIEDVVKQIIIDFSIYGGFALNIVRNRLGGIAGVYNLDFKNIRSNKNNTTFYYSEDWANKSLGRIKNTSYPAFDPDDKEQLTSVYYYKDEKYKTYPSPRWGGSVKSAEVLKHIAEFHLNSLYNGLSSDYIVNMNAGIPSDDIKEEIEDNFNERFTGWQNGGRAMLSWNSDFAHRTTIEAIPQNSFIDRYNALEKSAKQDIYCAFNISPAILGLPSENLGFSDQDLIESWRIATELLFRPILKVVKRAFEKIFSQQEVVSIEIVNIDFNKSGNNTEEIVK